MACKAPFCCCKAVGDACDSLCRGCAGGCQNCCKAVTNLWAPIAQNPLGLYVIGTWCMMALIIAACGVTVSQVRSCTELQIFCYVDIGIAVVHMVFAVYIQQRLVAKLMGSGGDSKSHREITQQAKELLKYDIAFCFYVFFFLAAFGYNIYGIGFHGACPDTSYQKLAVGLMIVYGVGAWNYSCCWFFGQCCFGAVEKKGVVKVQAPEKVLGAPVP